MSPTLLMTLSPELLRPLTVHFRLGLSTSKLIERALMLTTLTVAFTGAAIVLLV
jgi:hypothetical protein